MEIYTKTAPNWRSTQFYVRTTPTAKTNCLLACIFYTFETSTPLYIAMVQLAEIQI